MIDYSSYSVKQYKKIYQSTIKFEDFISKYVDLKNKKIIDLGCGGGANTIFLSKKYPESLFLGLDYQSTLIKYANKKKTKDNVKNCKFKIFDWKNVGGIKNFDGIVSFQALSFLDLSYEFALKKLTKNKFSFLAFSSLFYDGFCNYKIHVDDFSKSDFSNGYYNIYSLHSIKKVLYKNGYKKFFYEKFNIKIDLPKPNHRGMGSYTVLNKNNERMIFSGSLYLPYGFILAI
jgi:cyclopropane fatty-acyl-phospholipid synthase-like methyltransferase